MKKYVHLRRDLRILLYLFRWIKFLCMELGFEDEEVRENFRR